MDDQPLYRLKQPAYMRARPDAEREERLAADTEVVYLGKPGEHMEPLNDAAREAFQRAKPAALRPEMKLAMFGPGGGEAGEMNRQAAGLLDAGQSSDPVMLAHALVRIGALEAQVAMLMAKVGLAVPAPTAPLPRQVAEPAVALLADAPPPPPPPRRAPAAPPRAA